MDEQTTKQQLASAMLADMRADKELWTTWRNLLDSVELDTDDQNQTEEIEEMLHDAIYADTFFSIRQMMRMLQLLEKIDPKALVDFNVD